MQIKPWIALPPIKKANMFDFSQMMNFFVGEASFSWLSRYKITDPANNKRVNEIISKILITQQTL